jgi:hypothetical protein
MAVIKRPSTFKNLIHENYDEEIKVGDLDFWKKEDESVYDKIIDGFRNDHSYLDYDWWESTYEYFQDNMMKKYGWAPETGDMSFTGFWSQGDGASFEGNMDASEVAGLLKGLKLSKGQQILVDLAEGGSLYIDVNFERSGRYVHEKSVSTNVELQAEDHEELYRLIVDDNNASAFDGLDIDGYDEDEHYDLVEEYIEDLYSDYEEIIDEWRLDACHELYKMLEEDYEGLTSKEAIIDTIEANGYEFDEFGDIV